MDLKTYLYHTNLPREVTFSFKLNGLGKAMGCMWKAAQSKGDRSGKAGRMQGSDNRPGAEQVECR